MLKDFDEIPKKIKLKHKLTNGEKLYLNYGFLGIRGEVKDGMAIVFNGSLPYLEEHLLSGGELNSSLVKTLLYLMTKVEDTTIVNRMGDRGFKYGKKRIFRTFK